MFQFTRFFAKMRIPCTQQRILKAVEKYVECEKEIKDSDRERTTDDYSLFSRAATLLFGDALAHAEADVLNDRHIPKHGPGATADRLRGNAKFAQLKWPLRLEPHFPSWDFIVPGLRFREMLDAVDFLEPGREEPVRVITVPKTLKTPRIIAIEPTAMQYAQQSLMELFVHYLERDDFLQGMVGFTDQEPNQLFARKGSIDGSLATLDLSEASDRVSNQLVLGLLKNHPHLSDAVQACRSRKAEVPGHGVLRLAKFSSMGSALCFPMEAMVFLCLIFVGIAEGLGRQLDRNLILEFRSQVRVFGDDMIVPNDLAPSVVRVLENFGFRVNRHKSFWTGLFRESCGKEYYAGDDVSVVKMRSVLPSSRTHVAEVIATVKLRNLLYQQGLWATCQWLDDNVIGKVLPHYPVVESTSAVLGRESASFAPLAEQVDPDLHVPLVRGYVVSSQPPVSRLDGEFALLKFFIKRGDEPYEDGHLERAGRPEAVYLKLRWKQPY